MRLVTFDAGFGPLVGALLAGDDVLDLSAAAKSARRDMQAFASMQALIEGGAKALDRARALIELQPDEAVRARTSVRLLPPLPRPVRLRDCSLFLQHMEKALLKYANNLAAEASDPAAALAALLATDRFTMKPIFREQVLYYNADHLAISGPEEDILWPSYSSWMDYELEWACVIGSSGRDIARDQARRHIFGYTIFNDWSARDVQMPVMEGKLGPGEGKDFAGGNGLGPCIATPDEFADPYALTMAARVNGEEWSRGSTGTMHHSFEDAIAQFSRCKTLHAGEVIGSGTVLSGCGFELGRRLADGDVVELEIDGIGVLRNRVVRDFADRPT
jgi:2-keto-4-pentenoate hydratase/2-oxohepta-3-ene-1,7-dioic acid hydratase in catechol pathway